MSTNIKTARWQQIRGETFESANVVYMITTKTMIFEMRTAKFAQANLDGDEGKCKKIK